MAIDQVDSQTYLVLQDKYASFAVNFLGIDPKIIKDEDVAAVMAFIGRNIRDYYQEFHEEFDLESAMFVIKTLEDCTKVARMAVIQAAKKGGKFESNHLKSAILVPPPPKPKPEMFSLGACAPKEEAAG